ncbi:Predicted arabinose efflux permease, MFS family [Streptomyces sp. OV198]|uniref:MFS transporter n=1 Tax=Streptomyces sp. OV198 TaxID=1882787 RepID=UPI000BC9838F|nr:MFS transporter [Streptomyces sp. OV198]SOE79828.1 Predicted arabinose efflux permease, MFS family [Streptomyces sp. OV198]
MEKRYSLRLYLAGAVAARAGDEMSGPALMLTGFALAGSPTDASSLLAGITISAAVGGPVLGALLDRAGRPGRLLAVALVLYAAGLGMILLGLGRMPFAVIILIAVATGLLGPALSGGWTAQLPRMVLGDRLPRANTLDAMTFSVASLAGPALAGGVAEALGAPTAVVVSVGLIALALPAAWMLPARPGRARSARTTSLISELATGMRVIVGRQALARATLTSVVSCVAQGMLTACIPLLSERVLGGAGRGAVLLSCAAISALVVNAVLARFPPSAAPDTIIWASALVQAAALALATWRQPVVLIVAVLIAGIGEGPQLAALFAIRHREAPEHLRAQIFTTGASLKITGFALGAAVAGPVVTRSIPGALALAASAAVLAALAFFAIRSTTVNSSEDRAMSS